jgi:hypothetical protein
MGIHLLHCAHGNEQIGTYDAIRDTFVAITGNVGFHMKTITCAFFNRIQLLLLMN